MWGGGVTVDVLGLGAFIACAMFLGNCWVLVGELFLPDLGKDTCACMCTYTYKLRKSQKVKKAKMFSHAFSIIPSETTLLAKEPSLSLSTSPTPPKGVGRWSGDVGLLGLFSTRGCLYTWLGLLAMIPFFKSQNRYVFFGGVNVGLESAKI